LSTTGRQGREKRTINTKHILFIMSGAFNGLEEMVKKRLNREGIGFEAEIRSKDERAEYLKQVKRRTSSLTVSNRSSSEGFRWLRSLRN
jgi:ATP-dependent protease Clp ATPase subunit